MRIALFSARPYDRREFTAAALAQRHQLSFFEARLSAETASLAEGFPALCTFVNDLLDAPLLATLASLGVKVVALRCAGFNQVDLEAASRHGIVVLRVPAYSPHAVAEHAVGLILTLNRKFHRAYARVRDDNFLLDGLEGFDLYGKTVGVVGTGRIGRVFAGIMRGFGCRVLASDVVAPDPELQAAGIEYVTPEALLATSDIVSLHCPLTPHSHHLIDAHALATMKRGAMLINTSRGGLLDTAAVIEALKRRQLGALGIDVYEQEGDLFFKDLSSTIVDDDLFQRLLTFPNVLVTAHQAFFTTEALQAIARITLENITEFESSGRCANQVTLDLVKPA
jgi:D-lactate dehydrogenase